MWQTIFGTIGTLALAALLARQFLDAMAKRKAEPHRLFQQAFGVLDSPRVEETGTVGVYTLWGHYKGLPVQVKAVADTLATRKLPSLWMLVTIPEPMPETATFDLMMRPAGTSSFSNYDKLPHALPNVPGIPVEAIVRTDDMAAVLPAHVVVPHLQLFDHRGAKELLISPKGVRMVSLLAEGDRARYGVLRQADFGDTVIAAEDLRARLDMLIALKEDVTAWRRKSA